MAHRSPDEMVTELKQARELVANGAHYVHFKNPHQEYEVLDLAFTESDDALAVIYRALYGEKFTFVRPLASWLATVEHEGTTVPRFRKVV